ncbi:hypothetical protein DRO48_01285 [Candidatus Bathyarchaeota archaeon]|nr:MAG: hypothetical protein DRO48_01285 [Candidatus Bathyarchaeota archaeon]
MVKPREEPCLSFSYPFRRQLCVGEVLRGAERIPYELGLRDGSMVMSRMIKYGREDLMFYVVYDARGVPITWVNRRLQPPRQTSEREVLEWIRGRIRTLRSFPGESRFMDLSHVYVLALKRYDRDAVVVSDVFEMEGWS